MINTNIINVIPFKIYTIIQHIQVVLITYIIYPNQYFYPVTNHNPHKLVRSYFFFNV